MQYHFTDKNRNRKTATANVACPFGLSPNDELYLYGLLALTFAQPDPSPEFSATPHWCLKQLGIVDERHEEGLRYHYFREAVRRLAGVVYENDQFYDPIRGEHRSVAFGLLKYSLPTNFESGRAWQFHWDTQWFSFCKSISGSFTFDFTLYRSLDYASRRLFLLLSKIFWRSGHTPTFELRELGVHTLGFSERLRTANIKQKLLQAIRTLLECEVLGLPLGITDPRDLFSKRGKGHHVVQFHRGAYYDDVHDKPVTFTASESPLAEPLQAIGFDADSIHRIIRSYPSRLIAEWSDITLAAIERKLIRESPQAYFQHYIREAVDKKTTPPDWWLVLRKQERESEREAQTATDEEAESQQFETYLQTEAKQAFNRVMIRLFQELHQSGQSDSEAKKNAESVARIQLRRQFREEHPEWVVTSATSITTLLKRRLSNPHEGSDKGPQL